MWIGSGSNTHEAMVTTPLVPFHTPMPTVLISATSYDLSSDITGVVSAPAAWVGDVDATIASSTVSATGDLLVRDSFFTGLCFYLVTLASLVAWETWVVPVLKSRSILPDIPLVEGQLTEEQKRQPWIVPLTSDQSLPLPTWNTLVEKRRHRIGRCEGVTQYIVPDELPTIDGVQKVSSEWSTHYDHCVSVLKEKDMSGKKRSG